MVDGENTFGVGRPLFCCGTSRESCSWQGPAIICLNYRAVAKFGSCYCCRACVRRVGGVVGGNRQVTVVSGCVTGAEPGMWGLDGATGRI